MLTYEEIKEEYLPYEEGRKLVEYSREKYGNEESLEKTIKVTNVLIDYFKAQGFNLAKKTYMPMIEALVISALLRDLFFDGTFISLVRARHELEEYALDNGCDPSLTSAVFAAIESSMGMDTPNKMLVPTPDKPTGMLVIAIWVAENYI